MPLALQVYATLRMVPNDLFFPSILDTRQVIGSAQFTLYYVLDNEDLALPQGGYVWRPHDRSTPSAT
jgi:hypothetical protein